MHANVKRALIFCAVLILVAVAVGACSSVPARGVCAFMPIGQNESGVAFVRYQCEAAEQ